MLGGEVATDGEFRQESWRLGFVTKVRRVGPIVADEVAFSIGKTTNAVKATLLAPSCLHYPRSDASVDHGVYPDFRYCLLCMLL